jgi:hypothetical protein
VTRRGRAGRRLWAGVLLVLGLLAAWRPAAAQLLSPGPLANAHASIDGDNNCGKCHQSGRQVVEALCLSCHKDLAARLAAGAGLHGRNYKGKACEQCHVEHIGRGAKLVRWPGGSPDKLDHDLTGWTLEGDHRQVTCRKCHTKTSSLGKAQYLGEKPACASCHKDVHTGRFGKDCQRCHDLTEWKAFDQKAFDHKLARFALDGKHRDVACAKCHPQDRWTGLDFATCEGCHQDPHRGEFKPKACTACHNTAGWDGAADKLRQDHPWLSLRGGHRRVKCETCHDRGNTKAPSKGGACVDCHRQVHQARFGNRCESCHGGIQWLGLADKIGRDAHDRTSYPLAGRHTQVACAACHKPALPVARRFRGLATDRCGACHADVHQGEFASRGGGECGPCHGVDGFSPTRFGLRDHASTAFPLEGKHEATPCSGCHLAARPRLDLRVPGKRACADCHANPHGQQFAAEMSRGGCAQCHAAADWHRPRIDHATWPLTGAHARAACASCHGAGKQADQPAAYRGVPRDCAGCHDDVHAGQFATTPARACGDCHDTRAFKLPAFDHAALARYPLDGKHAPARCAACHPTAELRNGATAVRYRLGYRECRDCHANPHREPGR